MPLVHETCLIGAGIGGGFNNASELRPIKHKKAISGSDKEKMGEKIDEEWERMVKNNALKAVKRKDAPKEEKITTNAWEIKKKASVVHRTGPNARGLSKKISLLF